MIQIKSPHKGSNTIQNHYNTIDAVEQFKQAIQNAGITPPDEIIADGKSHRFSSSGRGGDTAGEYRLYLDSLPAGFFKCYRLGIYEQWHYKANELHHNSNMQHTANLRQVMAQKAEQRAKEKQLKQSKAIDKANYIWSNATSVIKHPYLDKKGVRAYGLKQYKDALIMPLYGANNQLCSMQFINEDNKKVLLKDSKTKGAFYTIGSIKDKVLLCEGYATGATLYELTNLPCVVAVSAYNLLACGQVIRDKYPNSTIIICADNDQHKANNAGIEQATQTAKAINALVAIPQFKDLSTKPTDFNDLYLLEGKQSIKGAFINE